MDSVEYYIEKAIGLSVKLIESVKSEKEKGNSYIDVYCRDALLECVKSLRSLESSLSESELEVLEYGERLLKVKK